LKSANETTTTTTTIIIIIIIIIKTSQLVDKTDEASLPLGD